ncbi:hypothetical protein BUMB_05540 [Candidatus Paraburkholderia calva]|nr:hypothetical protein BUMB_05540 [Candidatus Paraburkholderia calva]
MFIENIGLFASLAGVVLWIYLLVASFNEDVSAVLSVRPLREDSAYYILTILLTEWKARVVKC